MSKEKYTLYMVYDENEDGGGIKSGQENEAWPEHEDSHHSFRPICLLRKNPGKIHIESFEVSEDVFKCNELYAFIVRYSSGSTFGKSYGHWSLLGIFKTRDEVSDFYKKVNSDDYDGYKCWVGYFEELEGFETHKLSVKNKYKATEDSGDMRYFDHT